MKYLTPPGPALLELPSNLNSIVPVWLFMTPGTSLREEAESAVRAAATCG